ncbi:MAG TPA: hypothetical protein VE631_07865 [Alphaproteobacteria bacterium]|nr:hypothetical protein [Alphaproteobacteria bacterium]
MLTSLGRPTRVWAVPAVFGEAGRLAALHRVLQPRLQAGDRLVYLGNYMGRGPRVAETFDELLGFRRRLVERQGWPEAHVVHLRGAQEEMWVKLLQIQWALHPADTFDWMMAQGVDATLRAYGGDPAEAGAKFRAGVVVTTRWTNELRENFMRHKGHYHFLHRLSSAAFTDDGGLLLVSAGLDPARPLEKQNDLFWWSSPAFEAERPRYGDFTLVVRGYDAEHAPPAYEAPVASIDAGCGFGGPLSAACFAADGSLIETLEAPAGEDDTP